MISCHNAGNLYVASSVHQWSIIGFDELSCRIPHFPFLEIFNNFWLLRVRYDSVFYHKLQYARELWGLSCDLKISTTVDCRKKKDCALLWHGNVINPVIRVVNLQGLNEEEALKLEKTIDFICASEACHCLSILPSLYVKFQLRSAVLVEFSIWLCRRRISSLGEI